MKNDCEECGIGIDLEDQEMALVGSDVVGLFPAMKSANSGRIIRKRMEKGHLKVKGFRYKNGLRYIAMNRQFTSELDEIEYMLPKRKKSKGVTPGMTGEKVGTERDDLDDQWCYPKAEEFLSDEEKVKIRARVAEIGVRVLFEHFVYRWGGELFQQTSGGPIGCRVTMAVARIVM